ncbi:MAG: DUF4391 domain-containing protein [Paraburkholderia sp.]|uniref:DUF4391 domain-containing protein n=1 Tax=Paraburkholderia sp. TaxID=1926495 RepID=UPI003C35148A
MTAQDLITSLDLPGGCRVDQRVPKKMLIDNGASTASDKRQINEGIEEIQWVAVLKPNTIGISAYRDEQREYTEIAVLVVLLRGTSEKPVQSARLGELVHRAVPYPVILLLEAKQSVVLSLGHKRHAQNETGKAVLDDGVVSIVLPDDAPSPSMLQAFMHGLALTRQSRTNLFALYDGLVSGVEALQAAKLTGLFERASSPEEVAARRLGLVACQHLKMHVARVRAQASKEKQLSRKVALNLELKRLEAALAAALTGLSGRAP